MLEIAGRLNGGSDTFRVGLTALINDKNTFYVLNRSEYSSGGQTERVDFGLYDPEKRNIVIDFADFSPKRPEIDLGLVFYHEGVGHGEKGLPDEGGLFSWTAPLDTAKVARELNLPQPAYHTLERWGDRYFIRVVNPVAPTTVGRIIQSLIGRGSTLVDVTDVVKPK